MLLKTPFWNMFQNKWQEQDFTFETQKEWKERGWGKKPSIGRCVIFSLLFEHKFVWSFYKN